jgi:hypothetical protein
VLRGEGEQLGESAGHGAELNVTFDGARDSHLVVPQAKVLFEFAEGHLDAEAVRVEPDDLACGTPSSW